MTEELACSLSRYQQAALLAYVDNSHMAGSDLYSCLYVISIPRAPAIEGEGNGNGLPVCQASFHCSS